MSAEESKNSGKQLAESRVVVSDKTFAIKRSMSNRKFLTIALVVFAIIISGLIYIKIQNNKPIVVGDTKITKNDRDQYAALIDEYKKQYPDTDFGGDANKVAKDDLILNAAFKQEAKQRNDPLTDADLIVEAHQTFNSEQEKQDYIYGLKHGSKLALIRHENEAYKLKFGDDLIARKNLLMAEVNFDTPYHHSVSAQQAQQLYDQGQALLNKDILPLMKSGATSQQIASQVNQAFTPEVKKSDGFDYGKQLVKALEYIPGYESDKGIFNDIDSTSYIRGNVGKLYDTDDKVATLKNPGDVTDVFASKTGAHMIIRLESKTSGKYDSWTDFLNSYKAKYVNKSNKSVTRAKNTVIDTSKIAAIKLQRAAFEQATAATTNNGTQVDCSLHAVQLKIVAYNDTVNANIFTPAGDTPTTVRMVHHGTTCESKLGDHYRVGSSANALNTHKFIDDNCFTEDPDDYDGSRVNNNLPPDEWPNNSGWDVTDHVNPTKYDFKNQVNTRPGSSSSPNENSFGKSNGWPEWKTTQGLLNGKDVEIVLHYKTHNPTWQLVPRSDVGDPTIAAGEHTTIHHSIRNTGPDNADYDWHVEGCYSGSSSGNPCSRDSDYQGSTDGGNTWGESPKRPGDHSGSPNNVAKGSYNPSDNSYTYKFPTSAGAGAIYCQRIYTTHVNGPTSGPGHSERACVTLSQPVQSVCKAGQLSITVNKQAWGTTSQSTRFRVKVLGTQNVTGVYSQEYGTEPQIAGGTWYTDTDHTWNNSFTGISSQLYIDVEREHYKPNNPGKGWQPMSHQIEQIKTCYEATCSISVESDPDLGGKYGVIAGQQYRATISVRNPSASGSGRRLPTVLSNNNNPLSIFAQSNGSTQVQTLNGLDPGQTSSPRTFTFTAPSSGSATINANPTYFYLLNFDNNRNGQTASCSANIPVFQEFRVSLSATSDPKPTIENPTSGIDYNTVVKRTLGSSTVYIPTTSTFYKVPAGGGANTVYVTRTGGGYGAGDTYGMGPGNQAVLPVVAGDKFCSVITATYTHGYVNTANGFDVASTDTPRFAAQCPKVANTPYFKVFGKGIFAGGDFSDFDPSCSDGGTLSGFNDNSGGGANDRGSGSQLNTLALSDIIGVASAQNTGSPPYYASFANDGAGVGGSSADSPNLGGNLDNSHCIYNAQPPTDATTVGTVPTVGADGSFKYTGNAVISGGTVPTGARQSIFVKGDVYINGPITYQATTDSTRIPSFLIHATGNIYIDPSVQQLDGIYIAHKRPPSGQGGFIYTCGKNDGGGSFRPLHTTENFYGTCNKQLMIHGTFVAARVNLMRTYGSLRNATVNERRNGANLNCTNAGNGQHTTCAGEVFDFSPEMYLSNWRINPPNNGASTYQYITSLPPVL